MEENLSKYEARFGDGSMPDQGFMGMIIPEEFGGLGFSAAAHSAVVRAD